MRKCLKKFLYTRRPVCIIEFCCLMTTIFQQLLKICLFSSRRETLAALTHSVQLDRCYLTAKRHSLRAELRGGTANPGAARAAAAPWGTAASPAAFTGAPAPLPATELRTLQTSAPSRLPSLPASPWGNTRAARLRHYLDTELPSRPGALAPGRFQPGRGRGGCAGTWLWCRWASGSAEPRAGAAPRRCSSAESCSADRLWLAPKTRSTSSVKLVELSGPGPTPSCLSIPAGRGECGGWRSPAAPPWLLPTGSAGRERGPPARPLPGGRTGDAGRAAGPRICRRGAGPSLGARRAVGPGRSPSARWAPPPGGRGQPRAPRHPASPQKVARGPPRWAHARAAAEDAKLRLPPVPAQGPRVTQASESWPLLLFPDTAPARPSAPHPASLTLCMAEGITQAKVQAQAGTQVLHTPYQHYLLSPSSWTLEWVLWLAAS